MATCNIINIEKCNRGVMKISTHQLKQKINVLREKEELARDATFRIAKEKNLSENIVFQGGNALHFIYSSPRYSYDLDFVLKDKKVNLTWVVSAICDVLEKEYNVEKARNNNKNLKVVERIKYWKKNSEIRGVIEIGDQISLFPIITKGEFYPLLVEQPREIFADKIVATLDRIDKRDSLKGTDLFDILYIKNVLKELPTAKELRKKAETYGFEGWRKEVVKKTIEYISSEKNFERIETDIRKSMMPDVSKIYKFGKEFFEDAASCFVNLLTLV